MEYNKHMPCHKNPYVLNMLNGHVGMHLIPQRANPWIPNINFM